MFKPQRFERLELKKRLLIPGSFASDSIDSYLRSCCEGGRGEPEDKTPSEGQVSRWVFKPIARGRKYVESFSLYVNITWNGAC